VPWFRDLYADAVKNCGYALRPNEKLIALIYADYAGDADNPRNNVSWVSWPELSEKTGIRSKDALNRALRGLEKTGWLKLKDKRTQHKSPRYWIVIPDHPEVRETYVWDGEELTPEVREADRCPVDNTASVVRETDHWDSSEVRETTPEVRETTPRGTPDVPDHSKENRTIKGVVGPGAQPQDARDPACPHRTWTHDHFCVKCDLHEPCADCRRLLKITPDGRCWQHQDHVAAS
jgi:hypothetical protein